ncbi:MAG: hypothetical protein ACHP6I_00735 [Rickettsiales bacterium]
MKNLIELITTGDLPQAKLAIDALTELSFPPISSEIGNFDQHPFMAMLFHGEFEIFAYFLNTRPEIKDNLHQAFSGNHKSINVGEIPKTTQLAGSHQILNYLYDNFTPQQIIETRLLNIAVFFMHEELVDKFLSSDAKVAFADVANLPGSRSATPINYCTSCYDLDARHKLIFDKLFSREEIKSNLHTNKGFILQLLDVAHFKAVKELIEQGFIISSTAFTSLVNGLTRIPHDCELDEVQRGHIEVVSLHIINLVDVDILKCFCDEIEKFHPLIQIIYAQAALKKFAEKEIALETLIMDAPQFLELLTENPDWDPTGKNTTFLKIRKEISQVEKKVDADLITRQKDCLKTFTMEIENAAQIWYHSLRRGGDNNSTMPFGFSQEDEEKRSEVLKRIFLTIGSCGLEVRNPYDNSWGMASTNGLPLCIEFTIGPRVLIEIPPANATHAFFNWITCGVPAREGMYNENISRQNTGAAALIEDKIIFTRPFASHALSTDGEGHLQEEKLNFTTHQKTLSMLVAGASNMIGLVESTQHFGMNIGVGKYGELDAHGKTIRPDGSTGHLYMCYKPPTSSEPGGILVGIEGSEPLIKGQYGSHSLIGGSDELTVAGGRQCEELSRMLTEDTPSIANRYNSRRVILTNESIASLYQYPLHNIQDPAKMVTCVAANSVSEFTSNLGQIEAIERTYQHPITYTFEAITSPYHALFIPLALKKELVNIIRELSIPRCDALSKDDLDTLKSKYTEIFQGVITAFKKNNLDLHIESFSKSLVAFLAAVGRNKRLQLICEVHTEVLLIQVAPIYGNATAARALNIGGYILNAITANKETGLGIGSRLSPSVLNNTLAALYPLEQNHFRINAKLIITKSAHDITESLTNYTQYNMCGGMNIKEGLEKVLSDHSINEAFKRGELEIVIPYAQALPYISNMPNFTRGHYTLLHLRYVGANLQVINFDPKSYHSNIIYPVSHIRDMIAEATQHPISFKLETQNLGWQTTFDNRDCGRFMLVMIEHLTTSPFSTIGTLMPEFVNKKVKELVSKDEQGSVKCLAENIKFKTPQLTIPLNQCLLELYTNIKSPTDEEIKQLLALYKTILSQTTSDVNELDNFRKSVERALGAAGRHRRLLGVFEIHKQVLLEKGWLEEITIEWPLPWNHQLSDFIAGVAGQTINTLFFYGAALIQYIGPLIIPKSGTTSPISSAASPIMEAGTASIIHSPTLMSLPFAYVSDIELF